MIPRATLVTGLVLLVLILAFAGLAVQRVPTSTTETYSEEQTQSGYSYSPYMTTETVFSTATSSYLAAVVTSGIPETFPPCPPCGTTTAYYIVYPTQTILVEKSATIPYINTRTNVTVQELTNMVPFQRS